MQKTKTTHYKTQTKNNRQNAARTMLKQSAKKQKAKRPQKQKQKAKRKKRKSQKVNAKM